MSVGYSGDTSLSAPPQRDAGFLRVGEGVIRALSFFCAKMELFAFLFGLNVCKHSKEREKNIAPVNHVYHSKVYAGMTLNTE